jgi:hypothetical protein
MEMSRVNRENGDLLAMAAGKVNVRQAVKSAAAVRAGQFSVFKA